MIRITTINLKEDYDFRIPFFSLKKVRVNFIVDKNFIPIRNHRSAN